MPSARDARSILALSDSGQRNARDLAGFAVIHPRMKPRAKAAPTRRPHWSPSDRRRALLRKSVQTARRRDLFRELVAERFLAGNRGSLAKVALFGVP